MTMHHENTQLSRTVRELHRHLLDTTRRGHEAVFGPVRQLNELLRLIDEDPLFAWLKPLTRALAEWDDAIDAPPEEAHRVTPALQALRSLLLGEDSTFTPIYRQHLQEVPEVLVAHGQVRALLTRRAA